MNVIAVDERLPFPHECDDENRCWWFRRFPEGPAVWVFDMIEYYEDAEDFTHFADKDAFPVPSHLTIDE